MFTARTTIRAALVASAVLTLLSCARDRAPEPEEMRGTPYSEPRAKPDFTLNDTSGQPYRFGAETEGFVTLLFFGYTHCPDVCPIHMANIGAVLRTLHPEVSNKVKVVMVSVDPDRDTPERLRSWLDNFDRSFVGLRGPLDAVNEIQGSLGLPPAVLYGEGEDYTVGHSARVIAFTTDNYAHFSYPFGTRQADWAHDLPMLVMRDWSVP